MKKGEVWKYWEVLDALPDGWVIDHKTGSPLHGHVFITNGKSLLSGQQIRALMPIQRKQPAAH